ncbi:kinesin-like protein KIF20B isoform X2 [Crotalus tigris]|uniref:kinesin-like protein KIF20B isoform X2 n=1 Tax=Crotalus tigris TaxID=88082 RepID=UPI00192F39D5|nr:kinesin-like protein KIF20B isoform X2 [Crotalus tigris]
MEANLDKPTVSRPSFLSAVELSPRTGPVDASDVKKNLYGDFSSSFNISRRESLESKERIHVCLRVRPILELEKEHDVQGCVSVVDSTSVVLKAPKGSKTFRLSEKNLRQLVQKFTFSQVFGPKTTQEELFDGALKHPMLDFLRGHSRLIFTYGVTNAGKTHTYRGTDEDKGILPRALDMLFKSIQNKLYPDMNLKPHRCKDHRNLSKEEVREEISLKNSLLHLLKEVDCHSNSNRTTDNCEDMKEPEKEADQSNLEEQRNVKFSVWVSFCEIYNECIYDLLLPISIDKRRKMLRLAQDIKGYSYVKDLQWVQVSNSKEAYKLVKLGLRHQSYASTKLNANSSRSHSIFTVKMLKIDSETTRVMQVNELFLCDLAGSERYTRTCNEGERLKESGNINTSLLILGKCINALKINQQTKLQQHIPFRESKLTHFFQGFFNGKGKVCMIVNVSQSPSAYDETLNVLKFSAIAQKVMVLDPESPQEERVDQLSLKADSEMTLDDGVRLPMKRATIFWEGTLEDVMEDEEELVEDDSEEHQGHCLAEDPHAKEADATDEMENQLEGEDSDIIIRKEEYQKLLDIIEELKNKLIDEKKAKLYMELKIREEVTQECLQYFNAKESDLKKIFSYKEEIMETTCEERMSIYKELVKDCIALPDGKAGAEETLKKDEKVGGGEDGEPGNVADLPSMVGSLQQNVADIKKQAEMAFGVLDALEEPQLTIERLEKQLTDITAELAQAHEDLLSQNKAAVMQEDKLNKSAKVLQDVTEKMALQNKHIQELSQAVQQKDKEISQLQALVGHLEASIKDSEIASVTMKQENGSKSKEEGVASRRKRYLERDEEGPPSKQGFIHSSSKDSIDSEKADETRPHHSKEKGDMVTLEEKNKMLEAQVALLREKLVREENEKVGISSEIARLSQALSLEKEKASGLNRELQQQQTIYEQATLEIAMLKEGHKSQEEKIQTLLQEIGAASQITVEEKSQVKTLEVELGLLNRLGSHCPVIDVDLANQENMSRDEPLPTRISADQKSSFHCSVEGIWKISQQIINASSQKSSCIADLMQQAEQLQRKTLEADEENSQLKLELSETISQRDAFAQEKTSLLNQLGDLQQKNAFYVEKYKEEENRALVHSERLKTNEDFLEECRAKDVRIVSLEQIVKDKDSAILVMKQSVQDMEEKLSISEAKIGKFMDQESLLKVEVVDLKRLNEVERKKREESKQVTKELKEQLLKSTDLSSRLQAEIQQKDEEYADLKEKLADTKKQIEQVQKQVSTMRAEEKLLRSKVNELEKTKGQLTEELDLKQRTIQQFKKDDLSKKLEDLSQQYQKSREDVRCKEKIIEDMRLTLEEQEQTQSEQEQMLQATLEENEKCKAELKEWDKRYHELKEQKNDLRSQDINEGHEKNTNLLHEQLKQSQEKLEECKELHETDRRKWLAEKTLLITQAKEAETLRNKEIKKFAGDKEYYAKQLTEAEKLVAEKDHDLQRWRVERDKLVAALEIQLSSLISSNVQKDKEMEELKKMILKSSGKEHKTIPEGLRDDDSKELIEIGCKNVVTAVLTISNGAEKTQVEESSNSKQVQQHALSSCDKNDSMPGPQMWDPSFADRCSLAASSQPETVISEHAARFRILKEKQANLSNCNTTGNGSLLQQSSKVSSGDNILDQPDAVLDSYEVSSESEQISRFPKPEMEIQFSPLQPNKMEVKHQGSPSTVTLKVPRTRKRKSCTMDEDSLENENEKNVKLPANMNVWSDSLRRQGKKTAPPNPSVRKNYSLRNKHASNIKSTASPGGTLQKFGNLLQNSPTIIQTKAKKLMATIKSPKSTDEETVTKNDDKPKKAKRKLHSVNISNPVEFSGHVIVEDQKESDHEIIKRRLRMKKK